MNKDDPQSGSYLIDFANAYRIYRDVDIARDIARIRKPKEVDYESEPKRTAGE